MADYISGSELIKQKNIQPFQLLELIVKGKLKPLNESGKPLLPPDIAWCQKKSKELIRRHNQYQIIIPSVTNEEENLKRTDINDTAVNPVFSHIKKVSTDIQSMIKSLREHPRIKSHKGILKIKGLNELLDEITKINSHGTMNLWKGFDYNQIQVQILVLGFNQTLKEILLLLSGDSTYYKTSSGEDKETTKYKIYCAENHVKAIWRAFKGSYLKGNKYPTFGPGHFVFDESELGNEVKPNTKPIIWDGGTAELAAFYDYLEPDYFNFFNKGNRGELFCDHFIIVKTGKPPKKSSFIRAQNDLGHEQKIAEIANILSRAFQ
jgi:hypothetical protein